MLDNAGPIRQTNNIMNVAGSYAIYFTISDSCTKEDNVTLT